MQAKRREDIIWLNEVLHFLQQDVLDQPDGDNAVDAQDVDYVMAFCREVYRSIVPQFQFQDDIVLFSPHEGLLPSPSRLPCPQQIVNLNVVVGILDRLSFDRPGSRAEYLLREQFFPQTLLNINTVEIPDLCESVDIAQILMDHQTNIHPFARFELERFHLADIKGDIAGLLQQHQDRFRFNFMNNVDLQLDPTHIAEAERVHNERLVRSYGLTPDFIDTVLPILQLLYDVNGHYPDMCSWGIKYNDTLAKEDVLPMKKLLHACRHSRARALHLRDWLNHWFNENPQQIASREYSHYSPQTLQLSELLLRYYEAFASELAPSLRTQCLRWFEQSETSLEANALPAAIGEALDIERSEQNGPNINALPFLHIVWEGEGEWGAYTQQQRVQRWLGALDTLARLTQDLADNPDEVVNDDPKYGWTASRKG